MTDYKNYSQSSAIGGCNWLWKRKARRFLREDSNRIETEYQWSLLWDGMAPRSTGWSQSRLTKSCSVGPSIPCAPTTWLQRLCATR